MESINKWLHHDHIYYLHFKVYGSTGHWKILSPSKWKQFFFSSYFYLIHFAFIVQITALLIDGYLVRKDVGKITTNLYSTLLYGGTFVKIIVFSLNRDKIGKICDQLENYLYMPGVGKSQEDKDIYDKYAIYITEASRILWFMGIGWCIFWCIFPVLDSGNELRYPIPFPIYSSESPIYELIYAYQVPLVASVTFSVLTYDMIFYGIVARICVQYEIIAKNISGIKDFYIEQCSKRSEGYDEMDKKRNKQIVEIIKANVNHHRAILRYDVQNWKINFGRNLYDMSYREIKEVDSLFSIPLATQFICGGLIISVLAYGLITQSQKLTLEQMQRFFYVGCALFDIWLYCYFGSQLETKSNVFKEALYDTPWYEMRKEVSKLYIIILSNLQGKLRFRGAGIFPATLKTYKNMLKISYDLTAILRQTRKRN